MYAHIHMYSLVTYIRIATNVPTIGATIKYSYGWVELDTPGNVPLEVVVGYRMRDNIMCMCIRVTDMKATIDFLTKELGMQLLPYPLARDEGSRFEQEKAKGIVPPGAVSYVLHTCTHLLHRDTLRVVLFFSFAPYFSPVYDMLYILSIASPPLPPFVYGFHFRYFAYFSLYNSSCFYLSYHLYH